MAFKDGDSFHTLVIEDITQASTSEDDSIRWGLRFLIDTATQAQLADVLDSQRRMAKIRRASAYGKSQQAVQDGS